MVFYPSHVNQRRFADYVESGSILRFGGHEGEEALVDILLSRLSNILDKHDRLHMPISLDLLDALSSFPTRDSYSDADSFQVGLFNIPPFYPSFQKKKKKRKREKNESIQYKATFSCSSVLCSCV